MLVAWCLVAVYAFVGCVYWFDLAVGAARAVARVPDLDRVDPHNPPRWPSLSIVVAARNEAGTIEAALGTLLSVDYPDLQIIVVDDRSDDATGEIIDRAAGRDARVQTVHVTELPDGWLGKVHALSVGAARAEGEWLLLTDADVHLRADALRRAVAFAEARGLDHLAVLPRLETSSLLVEAMVAAFLRIFPVAMKVWAVSDPKSRAFIGVGAFNLVRRAALDQTQGFEWLRLEVADDAGLGLLLKSAGFRSAAARGPGLVSVEWYRSLADMARGAEKGYAPIGHCRPWRMWIIGLALTLLELAPLAMFLPLGHRGFWSAGVAMLAAGAVSISLIHRAMHRPLLAGLLFPVAAVIAAAIWLRAGWLGWRRGGVLWRDTFYPSEQLRAAARVRL